MTNDKYIRIKCPECSNEYKLYKSMLSEHGFKIACSNCYEKFIVEVNYMINVKKDKR